MAMGTALSHRTSAAVSNQRPHSTVAGIPLPAEGSEHQPHFNAEGARFFPQRMPSARKALVYTSDKTGKRNAILRLLDFVMAFSTRASTQLPRPLPWT